MGALTGPYDGDITQISPDEERQRRRRVLQHLQACIGEGMCPVHKTLMTPAGDLLGSDVIAGHCAECGSYWYANREKAGCQLDAGTLRARLAREA
jgi:hypothetical protein